MKPITYRVVIPKRRHIPEVASFLGQLNDFSRMMLCDTCGILRPLVEHRAGHYGQRLLLRHPYADRKRT